MGVKTTLKKKIERFQAKIRKTKTCWFWEGTKNDGGYGWVHFNGRNRVAHRVNYELLVKKIPKGLTLDHLCRNRACVKPAHLEPVSRGENVMRGYGVCANNQRKTHCIRGHKFTPSNTKNHPRIIKRECKKCYQLRQDIYWGRKRINNKLYTEFKTVKEAMDSLHPRMPSTNFTRK